MDIAQQCFGQSKESIEYATRDILAIREFFGIDLAHKSASENTALLKVRRRLETHNPIRSIFDEINGHLISEGLMIKEPSSPRL